MGRKVIALWLSLAMVLSFIVVLDVIIDFTPPVKGGIIRYVNETGSGGAYTKIQDAINASSDGDTVFVYNGTYYERVVVNKTINLTGKDKENTMIYGNGNGDVVTIVVDWANVSGFTIINGGGDMGDSGMKLINVNNCEIFNNNVSFNNWTGIYLDSSLYNKITNNTLLNNTRRGIHLDSSSNNDISGNNVSRSDWDGILLIFSSNNNTITDNNISKTGEGIYISSSSGNNITDNYLAQNGFGVYIVLGSKNNIMANNVTNNTYGFYLANTPYNNIIAHNNISNNDDGIRFASSSNFTITNNRIFSNIESGIYIFSSTYNNILANDIWDNNFGVEFGPSSENNEVICNNISVNSIGIYLFSASNNNITANNVSNNAVGIRIDLFSNNIRIAYNNVSSNNVHGIELWMSSGNNILIGNNVSNNDNGIRLAPSNNYNIIIGNNVSSNNDGIFLGSDNNNITDNYVWNNNRGIYLSSSASNNKIFHNNIIENTNQAFDLTNNENQWDDGYPSGGNYWSNFDEPGEGAYDHYQGVNQSVLGSDGIVDNGTITGGGMNPYVIDTDSQDDYPLIHPFGNYILLYEGWNLISIPFIQSDTNVGTIFSSIKDSYDSVQYYNITDKSDPWKHNHTSKPLELNDFDTMDHNIGIWIHITKKGGVLFQYPGTQPMVNQTIALHPGWNMVGYPSLAKSNRTEALNNLTFDTHVNSIWTFDSATKRWQQLGEDDYFLPHRGYWIHAITKCEWEVPL